MAEAHRFAMRVYYEDTDAAGIVYYANYLRFAERARTELLRQAGYDHTNLAADHGAAFAVRRCVIDYLKPARLDDELVVETRPGSVGGATADLRQSVRRGGDELARLDVRLAFVAASGRPRRLPGDLRRALATYLTSGS
ncbi:MAG: tol-pal system-associated acyl-CoA thioesterase [Alphaproteobacteria bacterium]|nr:tol-pal system-associated acyl-CoA thioesterase [Alphaproteobacteria bacterium]